MVPQTRRTRVYIDGFNFYYRALLNSPFKWLNYYELVKQLINSSNQIEKINYYTARVSGNKDAGQPQRQQIYLSALTSIPCLEIHYGNFLSKPISRPLVKNKKKFVEVHNTEEKGSDVNLATHLIFDACKNNFDVAIVLTKDTDFIEPLRIIKEQLGKIVGIICPDDNIPQGLQNVVTFVRHIRDTHLNNAQFPNTIYLNGKIIQKPAGW